MRNRPTPSLIALLAFVHLAASPGAAAGEPSATALYAEGRFVEAAQAASTDSGSADSLALAAKAYAAAALLADDPASSEAWGEEARASAEAAIALDPEHVEGRLQLAVALWLESRSRGPFDAYFAGFPQRGKALIEAALADDPDEAWAHAMLGAWHFEALRRGGRMAKRMLGADLAIGADAFMQAETLAPSDAAIPAQKGLAYLSMDPKRYRSQAAEAFDRALSMTPGDAFQAAMQSRAREARRLMDAGDDAALNSALARWFGG